MVEPQMVPACILYSTSGNAQSPHSVPFGATHNENHTTKSHHGLKARQHWKKRHIFALFNLHACGSISDKDSATHALIPDHSP